MIYIGQILHSMAVWVGFIISCSMHHYFRCNNGLWRVSHGIGYAIYKTGFIKHNLYFLNKLNPNISFITSIQILN